MELRAMSANLGHSDARWNRAYGYDQLGDKNSADDCASRRVQKGLNIGLSVVEPRQLAVQGYP